MADGRTIDKHNNSLVYVETQANSPPDGEFKAAWEPGGMTVTVSGPCPACGGWTATEFSAGIVGSKGFHRPAPRSRKLPSPVTLFCECGHAHADRPLGALDKGCGRFWLIYLSDDARQPPTPGAASTSIGPAVL